MGIRRKKARVDQLVREAESQRLARDQHAGNALDLVRRRVSSPLGLAVSFGAGAAIGYRRRPPQLDDNGDRDSWVQRIVDGPVGHIAIRIATATMANAIMKAIRSGDESSNDAAAPDNVPETEL
jgi:hypothetical protein